MSVIEFNILFILFLLLVQTKGVLQDLRTLNSDFQESFQIYADEGLAKHGSEQPVPVISKDFYLPTIKFASSDILVGLQIADFAAFLITKTQRIMFNKKAGI